jgi:hypothetical protein
MKKCPEGNPFVAISAVFGGIVLSMVVVVLIFAKEYLVHITNIVWAFAILGMVVSFFAYLAQKNKK